MAGVTYRQVEREIRYLLGVDSNELGTIDPDVILAAFRRAMRLVQSETDTTPRWTATFLTLTQATGWGPYTISATFKDPMSINDMRLTEAGTKLNRTSLTDVLDRRTSLTPQQEIPRVIAFEEATDGSLFAYVDPPPNQTYTVEATTVGIPDVPSDFASGNGAAVYATTVDFEGNGYMACLYAAAAELAVLPDLKLSPQQIQKLEMQAQRAMRSESSRVAGLIRQTGPIYRSAV